MKESTLAILLFLSFTAFAQITVEVDEYTGDTTTHSEWATINDPVWKGSALSYMRFHKVEGNLVLELATSTYGKILSVRENSDFYIKTENGEVLKLKTLKGGISGRGPLAIKFRGSKAIGIRVLFLVDKEDIEILSNEKVSSCRLTTSDGNLDIKPEKRKYKEALIKTSKEFLAIL